MVHRYIYSLFETYFEAYAGDKVKMWLSNGPSSIRIVHFDGKEFIFTFNSKNNIRFETVDSFINDQKKGRKGA